MNTFKVNSYETAAAATEAARRMIGQVLTFLIGVGMLFRMPDGEETREEFDTALAAWESDTAAKEKAAAADSLYRAARVPLIAASYDQRHKGKHAMRSLELDRAAVRALPQNSPVKTARAAVNNTARQDAWYVRAQYRLAVNEAFRLRDEALTADEKPAKPTLGVLATFDRFAKDVVSRNQKTGEINAGDLAAWVGKMRGELTAKLPAPLDLGAKTKTKAKAKAKA